MNIEFQILETAIKQKALLFTCQRIEQAYSEKQRTYIHTLNQEEAERLDHLLWTYRDDSFIPHKLFDASDPLLIGFDETIAINSHDLLINLSSTIPSFYKQFHHIIEIVFADSQVQQLARERYKQYRADGHNIQTIKINH